MTPAATIDTLEQHASVAAEDIRRHLAGAHKDYVATFDGLRGQADHGNDR